MKGWKTWAGVILIGLSAALKAAGQEDYSQILTLLGTTMGLVGIGHKLDKSSN